MDNLPPLGAAFYIANRDRDSAGPRTTSSTDQRPNTPRHEVVRPSSQQPRPKSTRPPSRGFEIRFYRHRADAKAQNERLRKELEDERRAGKAARKAERARQHEALVSQSQLQPELQPGHHIHKEREREREQEQDDDGDRGPIRSSRFMNPEPVYAEEVPIVQQPRSGVAAEKKTYAASEEQRQQLPEVKKRTSLVTQPVHDHYKSSRPSQPPVANMSPRRPATKHVRIADTRDRQHKTAIPNYVPRGADPASDKELAEEAQLEKELAGPLRNHGEARVQDQVATSSWARDYHAHQDSYREEELEWEAREQEAIAEMSSMVADNQPPHETAGSNSSTLGSEHEDLEREQMALVEQSMREMEVGSSAEQRRIYEGVRRGGGAGAAFHGYQSAGHASRLDYARKDLIHDDGYASTEKDKDIDILEERFGPRLADDVIEGLWDEHDDPPPPYEALRHDDCTRSGYTPSKSAYMDDAFR